MGYVRSFEDFAPPPRYDNVSFTSVKVYEAASADGPWTLIDTQALTPDVNPAQPALRDITTDDATLATGWYRLTWVDDNNSTFVGEPVQFIEPQFVSIEDVERVLGVTLTAEERSRMEFAIQQAISWASGYMNNPDLGKSGAGVATFYEVTRYIDLPPGVTALTVSTETYAGAGLLLLDTDLWFQEGSRVYITSAAGVWPGLPSWERAAFGKNLHRVVITTNAVISPALRFGISLAAAGIYSRQSSAGRGVRSETLGDYSYTLESGASDGGDSDPFFAQAKSILRPLVASGPVAV